MNRLWRWLLDPVSPAYERQLDRLAGDIIWWRRWNPMQRSIESAISDMERVISKALEEQARTVARIAESPLMRALAKQERDLQRRFAHGIVYRGSRRADGE